MTEDTTSNSFIYIGIVAALLIISLSGVTYILLKSRSSAADGTPVACTLEAKICPDGTAVGRVGAKCEFAACPASSPLTEQQAACTPANLLIEQPQHQEKVSFPLEVSGTVDNHTKPDCSWAMFEGQAGTMEVHDLDGTVLGQAPLNTTDDWMSEGPVTVEGKIELTKQPKSPSGTLVITEEDPSGQSNPQQLSIQLNF